MKLIFQRNLEDRYQKLHADYIVLSQEKDAVVQEKEAVVQENAAFIAEKLILKDRLDEAMKKIDDALAKNPDDGGAILTKGRIFKRQADKLQGAERQALLRQALAYAERAIDVMPAETKAEPTYNKACYQELLGVDKQEVLATLQAAFQLNPGLRKTARTDEDLKNLWHDADFKRLTEDKPAQGTQGS
jgi:tetratricopeptide (TPR) repeat protein